MEDPAHLSHLGVPEFDEDGRIASIVEKPSIPPSHYAVTGVYCYGPDGLRDRKTLKPSGRGGLREDLDDHYVADRHVSFDVQPRFWGDAGESIDAYQEVGEFVARDGANRPQG